MKSHTQHQWNNGAKKYRYSTEGRFVIRVYFVTTRRIKEIQLHEQFDQHRKSKEWDQKGNCREKRNSYDNAGGWVLLSTLKLIIVYDFGDILKK